MVNWLRKRRLEMNISQDELASRLTQNGFEVSRFGVSNWETERNQLPMDDPVFRWAAAKALEYTPQQLLRHAGYEVNNDQFSENVLIAARILERLPEEAQDMVIDLLSNLENLLLPENYDDLVEPGDD